MFGDETTSEFSAAVQVTGAEAVLNATVFLEGAYAGSGTMSVPPGFTSALPLTQPYQAPLFDGTDTEYDGVEYVTSLPPNVVDWVLVSLRSGTGAATEVVERPAFVRNDGVLVGLDGGTLGLPGVSSGSYYVVVRHRNHLGVMSASPVSFAGGVGTWDFTTALTQAFSGGGAAMKSVGGGRFALFAADGNVDGNITALDFNAYNAATTAGLTGYRMEDFNLDGNVTALDFNVYNANTTAGASSQVP